MAEQDWFTKMQKTEFGYETKTIFWQDFAIADAFGIKAVKDTYKRAFTEWKNNLEYCTELIMVLNHKSWFYASEYHYNESLSALYSELFYKARDYVYRHYKGDDFAYLYGILD